MQRMGISRRKLLHLAAAAALPAVPRVAMAQTYPAHPVRVIVGLSAGTAPDTIARLVAQWLSARFDRPFVVENRPGAGANLATQTVGRAPPDGYALLFVTASSAIGSGLYDSVNFNLVRDISPVACICGVPFVMMVNPSLPVKTVTEFIAYAKANPGRINMASVGNGSAPHIFGELFKAMAGVDLVHVPYRGNPLPDLVGGQVQVYFAAMISSIGLIRTGKLRALAVTTAQRSPLLADIPAMAEFLPGYEASAWQGVGAPKNTPTEIIEVLNKEINAGLADATLQGRLADLGAVPMPMTSDAFGKFIADETEKWTKVIKVANIRAD
jgi:tripartite-type tricarboxylate transporter receptor subunit TctC